MNSPWEWKEDDILRLIADQVKEDINLDYKACGSLIKTDEKKKEISKDVSAFANSAGGTIVYGVTEDNTTHLPQAIDVGFDSTDITKEWLEQVINSRIQRRIDGIRINPVSLPQTRPGKVLYVVSIPQSARAPHMASDHRFYKRFNFESVYMEEYEVRDVAHRSEAPDLHLELAWNSGTTAHLSFSETPFSAPLELIGALSNKAPMPAEYIHIVIWLDNRIAMSAARDFAQRRVDPNNDLIVKMEESPCSQMTKWTYNWAVPGRIPIWEGVTLALTTSPMHIGIPKEPGDYLLAWEMRSPRMTPRAGLYHLNSNGETISFGELQSIVINPNS